MVSPNNWGRFLDSNVIILVCAAIDEDNDMGKKKQNNTQRLSNRLLSVCLYGLAFSILIVACLIYLAVMSFLVYLPAGMSFESMGTWGLFIGVPIGLAWAIATSFLIFYDTQHISDELQKWRTLDTPAPGKARALLGLVTYQSLVYLFMTLLYAFVFFLMSIFLAYVVLLPLGLIARVVMSFYEDAGLIGLFVHLPLGIAFIVLLVMTVTGLRFPSRGKKDNRKKQAATTQQEETHIVKQLPTSEMMQGLISQDGEIPDEALQERNQS